MIKTVGIIFMTIFTIFFIVQFIYISPLSTHEILDEFGLQELSSINELKHKGYPHSWFTVKYDYLHCKLDKTDFLILKKSLLKDSYIADIRGYNPSNKNLPDWWQVPFDESGKLTLNNYPQNDKQKTQFLEYKREVNNSCSDKILYNSQSKDFYLLRISSD